MANADREVLLGAYRLAVRTLIEAREKAESDLFGARQDAMELLLRQQDEAARLLTDERQDAADLEARGERETLGQSDADRTKSRTSRSVEAANTLERQREAAKLLREGREHVANVLLDHGERSTNAALLASLKEAVGILLQAQRRVEAGESD